MLAFLVPAFQPILVATIHAGLAIIVYRARSSDRANRAFAAFMLIVAANYATVAIVAAFRDRADVVGPLSLVGFAFEIVEVPLLLAFASVYPTRSRFDKTAWRAGQWVVAFAFGGLLLVDPAIALDTERPTRIVFETYVTAGYAIVTWSFLWQEARRPDGAPRIFPRGFLVGWSVLLFLRLALSYARGDAVNRAVEVGGGSTALASLAGAGTEVAFAFACVGATALFLAWGRPRARIREITRLAAMTAIAIGALWCAVNILAILAYVFHGGEFFPEGSLLKILGDALGSKYAIRWIFFALAVGPAFLRNQIFDIDVALRRALLAVVTTGVLLLLFLAGLAALASTVEVTGGPMARIAAVIVLVALLGSQSVRLGRRVAERAFPSERDRDEAYRRMRRIELYRSALAAVADGRASPAELEPLRDSLRLTREEARAAAALASPPRPLAAGSTIAGRYRIEAPIARGGSGRVWRARDLRDSKAVAVKILDDALDRAANVEHELAAAKALRHPRVLPILDHGIEASVAYVVTPYIEGGSLAQALAREGGLLPARTMAIALDVLEALSAAHQKGVIHRDVKPSNVLLDGSGRAILMDFGIASATEPMRTATAILDPRVAGTLAYLPPEAMDAEPPTPAWDVYAMGTMLIELRLGRPPRSGERMPSDVDPRLAAVVARAREEDPALRYPDASAMLRDLR